ncbi:tyrosine-type recombinase/integrase [Streptococcus jiangjianxini]|uniref:tyrosine-type recombinase/integrase n=1 Tax=Streptococcus jiangjianxini TaxID=3161189 RepID=UPI0032EC3744
MTIKEYKKHNGEIVFRAKVYLGVDDQTGKKVMTTITGRTRKEVKIKVTQAKADFITNGKTVKPSYNITTFEELTRLWWHSYESTVKPNTKQSMKGMIDLHILPLLGSYRLDKLNTPTMQEYVNNWAIQANNGADGAFGNYGLLVSTTKRILQYGVTLQLIDVNPARDVVIPRKQAKEQKPIKVFTNQELKQFLDYLDTLDLSEYRNFFSYCLYKSLLASGCRISELLALEWSDIDFANQTISISKTLNRYKGVNSPKSSASNRVIDIDKATTLLLQQLKNRQRAITRERGYTEKVVFSPLTVQYIRSTSLVYRLKKDFKNAGVADIGFHGFRHTHASLMMNAGLGYKELQHRLGHATLAMTMDTYSHLSKENAKKAVSLFETAINTL